MDQGNKSDADHDPLPTPLGYFPSEVPTEPIPLEYRPGNLPLTPDDFEDEAESSRWFGYIGMGIILASMGLGILFVVLGVVYLLSR